MRNLLCVLVFVKSNIHFRLCVWVCLCVWCVCAHKLLKRGRPERTIPSNQKSQTRSSTKGMLNERIYHCNKCEANPHHLSSQTFTCKGLGKYTYTQTHTHTHAHTHTHDLLVFVKSIINSNMTMTIR